MAAGTADRDAGDADGRSWWRRPAGGREVLGVALPLVVSSLSWTVMTFVDRAMLFSVSKEAMNAAFSASNVWFASLSFPLGVCTYASTFVSQYHGAGQPRKIGPITWQALWIAAAFTPLVVLAGSLGPQLFRLAGHGSEVTDLEIRYLQLLCWGGPGMLFAQALSAFYSGRGETRVVMIVDSLFALLNLVLDYAWIFGKWGFPAAGIEGAALATVVSLWLKALCYLLLAMQRKHRDQFAIGGAGARLDMALLRRLFWFGGPNGLQMLLDVAGFTVFILIVGRLDAASASATVMAISINSLAFMPVWGVSLAASILVGQHLGENRDDLAARAAWTTLAIGLSYMAVFAALYVGAPGLFLQGFFTAGEQPTAQGDVYGLAVVLLRFVAAYTVFDAVLMIFSGAIKGAGDTQFVLKVSSVMAVLLAAACWVAVDILRWGIWGCWAVLTVWVWVLAVIFFARFLQGKWRSMRVIEPSTAPKADASAR